MLSEWQPVGRCWDMNSHHSWTSRDQRPWPASFGWTPACHSLGPGGGTGPYIPIPSPEHVKTVKTPFTLDVAGHGEHLTFWLCTVCMYGWMYGCMDVWMYGCMDVWTYGRMEVWMYVWMYGCMDVCMYVRMYVCTYVRMYVRTYVCRDGWMHACMYAWCRFYLSMYIYIYIHNTHYLILRWSHPNPPLAAPPSRPARWVALLRASEFVLRWRPSSGDQRRPGAMVLGLIEI